MQEQRRAEREARPAMQGPEPCRARRVDREEEEGQGDGHDVDGDEARSLRETHRRADAGARAEQREQGSAAAAADDEERRPQSCAAVALGVGGLVDDLAL